VVQENKFPDLDWQFFKNFSKNTID
jgi:hypothetical protein